MPESKEPELAAGTRLAHYEILRRIGSGAMGTVYEAHDEALDRSVAVKVLRAHVAGDPAFAQRFLREARAAARVSHVNLVHVYFVGGEGPRTFFAMEFVRGRTLEELVTERGQLPLADVVEIGVQAARGLGAAHAVGVVHRDVKPSNVLLDEAGVVKVTDFGLARSLDADVNASHGGLTGTPTFMSPEQFRGQLAGPAADTYSLGLVLWYLLAGRPPFAAQSLGELLDQQMNHPLPPLAAARPDLSPQVDEALARLCAKDPAARPQTMAEVAAILDSLRPREIVPAPLTTRGVAWAIDNAIALSLAAAVDLVLIGIHHGLDRLGIAPLDRETADFVGSHVLPLFFAGTFAAAFLLSETIWGSTPGKWLLGVRIVRADGTRAGASAAALRLLLRSPWIVFVAASSLPLPGGLLTLLAASSQLVAIVAGIVVGVFRGGTTLSDVVTRTRVAYRLTR
ncbi:MAG: Serine/threonine-protein kinase PknD [Planctomycetes bacterium]|nr:Serine/threonine-protein kinase PknD [Planctomycetota bacterium]